MNSRTLTSHSRFVSIAFALVIAFVALGYSPPPASSNAAICEEGCVNWNAQQGCVEVMLCCLFNDGGVMCWKNERPVKVPGFN